MASAIEDRKFNDDLLSVAHDREVAALKYPSIFHVLDHPELRDLFLTYDEVAKSAKRGGRIAGFIAIGLGFAALSITPIVYPVTVADNCVPGFDCALVGKALAAVSAGFGILCALIGGIGVLFARRKREWLRLRLVGERIRQFHFQTLVCRLPAILQSLKDDEARFAFGSQRKLWLETFKTRFIGRLDSELTSMLDEGSGQDAWLHECGAPAKLRDAKELEPLFNAYRELRILHQISYANYRLADDHRIISAMPRRQAAVLSLVSLVCIILLCVIDISELLGIIFGTSILGNRGIVHYVPIWIALIALAMRTIEQGLQPERETERYQQYRSALRAVLERFDRAASQNEKLRVMEEMERLSFDEMRNFLITNERSRFVM